MHSKHNKYIDVDLLAEKALANPSALAQKIPMLIEELSDAINCIKRVAPDKYFEHYLGLHKLICGNYFSEDLYEYAISLMENVDGTVGAKIQPDVVLTEARRIGLVPTATTNCEDIIYTANMYASDNWDKSLSNEENVAFAVKVAKGFLTDPDAPQVPGRALQFFSKVALWKPEKHK